MERARSLISSLFNVLSSQDVVPFCYPQYQELISAGGTLGRLWAPDSMQNTHIMDMPLYSFVFQLFSLTMQGVNLQ